MTKFMFTLMVWLLISFFSASSIWHGLYIYVILLLVLLYFSPLYLGFKLLGMEFGWDTISFSLVALSIWLVVLMITASYSILKEKSSINYFVLMLGILLYLLVLSFTSMSYLGFYFFFEGSLIPTLLIILGWGYQPERLQAGVYFMFYTITSSLPLLVMLFYIYKFTGSLSMVMAGSDLESGMSLFLSLLMSLSLTTAFLVKMPLFFVHLWLPKAHVEAPVSGSMILAGVLLKLGGYGLCRVMHLMPIILNKISSFMMSLGLMAMIYVGLMCCRLNDMKALVAYSSVAHMSMVVMGIYAGSTLGINGALMMMLGHGLSSSGLFCALNMYYERTGSRSFFVNSGMLLLLPTLALTFFMLCVSNIASPPSLNLLSEMCLMGGIMGFDKLMILMFPLGSFLGAVFSIFLFSYSQHGKIYNSFFSFWVIYMVEIKSLVLHIIPLNIIFMKSELFVMMV